MVPLCEFSWRQREDRGPTWCQHRAPPQSPACSLPPALTPPTLAMGSILNTWNRGGQIKPQHNPSPSFTPATPFFPRPCPMYSGRQITGLGCLLGFAGSGRPCPIFSCLRHPALNQLLGQREGEGAEFGIRILFQQSTPLYTPSPCCQLGGIWSLCGLRMNSGEGIWGHGAQGQCLGTSNLQQPPLGEIGA